jgi:hypothetical protein
VVSAVESLLAADAVLVFPSQEKQTCRMMVPARYTIVLRGVPARKRVD